MLVQSLTCKHSVNQLFSYHCTHLCFPNSTTTIAVPAERQGYTVRTNCSNLTSREVSRVSRELFVFTVYMMSLQVHTVHCAQCPHWNPNLAESTHQCSSILQTVSVVKKKAEPLLVEKHLQVTAEEPSTVPRIPHASSIPVEAAFHTHLGISSSGNMIMFITQNIHIILLVNLFTFPNTLENNPHMTAVFSKVNTILSNEDRWRNVSLE